MGVQDAITAHPRTKRKKEDMFNIDGDSQKFIEKANLSRQLKEAGEPMKVFDWLKAVEIIKEKGIKNASAGLIEDWYYTNATILEDGEIYEATGWLESLWATPSLRDDDTDTHYLCWIIENETKWDALTVWPEEAVEAFNKLKGENQCQSLRRSKIFKK